MSAANLLPERSGFNTETAISFKLSAPTTVECIIYNLAGELVCRLVEGEAMSPGVNAIRWNGNDADGRCVLSSMYCVYSGRGPTGVSDGRRGESVERQKKWKERKERKKGRKIDGSS